jgi:hypothetical protein
MTAPCEYVEVLVMPMQGITITGLIKKHNSHAMAQADVERAMELFNQLNESRVPKAGETIKIPKL